MFGNKENSKNLTHLTNQKQALPQQKLTRYMGFFAVGYVLVSVLFMLLQTQFSLNPQIVTVVSILAGAYIAVSKFIKHQHRPLMSAEMNRLTFGSVAIVWLLTALYSLGLWFLLFDVASREVFLAMFDQQPTPLIIALLLMVVVTLIGARLGIWGFNRLLASK